MARGTPFGREDKEIRSSNGISSPARSFVRCKSGREG